jgi:hypothetical protein
MEFFIKGDNNVLRGLRCLMLDVVMYVFFSRL